MDSYHQTATPPGTARTSTTVPSTGSSRASGTAGKYRGTAGIYSGTAGTYSGTAGTYRGTVRTVKDICIADTLKVQYRIVTGLDTVGPVTGTL